MSKTLQEQMNDVLAVEREKNNLIMAPVKRRIRTPDDVRRAKIAFVSKEVKAGAKMQDACKLVGVSPASLNRWMDNFGMVPINPDFRHRAKMAVKTMRKRHTGPFAQKKAKPDTANRSHKSKRKVHVYTVAERAEYVKKAHEIKAKQPWMKQGEIAKYMGINGATLCSWLHGKGGTTPETAYRGGVKVTASKGNGVDEKVTIEEAIKAFNGAADSLDFENRLLRAIIRRA